VLGIAVSAITILAVGATIVARFNTLENANDLRVTQIRDVGTAIEKLDNRILSLERNGELRERIAELRSDVAVLNEKVDWMSRRRNQ
jgi:hypothetical protein